MSRDVLVDSQAIEAAEIMEMAMETPDPATRATTKATATAEVARGTVLLLRGIVCLQLTDTSTRVTAECVTARTVCDTEDSQDSDSMQVFHVKVSKNVC